MGMVVSVVISCTKAPTSVLLGPFHGWRPRALCQRLPGEVGG